MSKCKFLQLQVGQQFEYQNEHYTKTSHLLASNNGSGQSRMVPRSALVQLLGEPIKTALVEVSPLQQALNRYHGSIIEALQAIAAEPTSLLTIRQRVEEEKQRFEHLLQQLER